MFVHVGECEFYLFGPIESIYMVMPSGHIVCEFNGSGGSQSGVRTNVGGESALPLQGLLQRRLFGRERTSFWGIGTFVAVIG